MSDESGLKHDLAFLQDKIGELFEDNARLWKAIRKQEVFQRSINGRVDGLMIGIDEFKKQLEVHREARHSDDLPPKGDAEYYRERVWRVIRELAEWEGYSEEFDPKEWVDKLTRAVGS